MKGERCILFNNRGVMAVIVALLFIVFLGIAALAVDVGYLYMAKNQLQNAADAAALAGARQLGHDLGVITNVSQKAKEIAKGNNVAGEYLGDDNIQIEIGKWAWIDKTLDTTSSHPNAVRVNATKLINTFFGRFVGRDTVSISAKSTASLTAVSSGSSGAPFVISQDWFKNGCPTDFYQINSNGSGSCIAWYGKNKNDVDFDCIYRGNHTGDCSPTKVTVPLSKITNGTIQNIFNGCSCTGKDINCLTCLFNTMRLLNDPAKGDFDNDPATWTTVALVVDMPCNSSAKNAKIVGFATITIKDMGSKTLNINAVCDVVKDDPGGGTLDGGNLGSIPKLVN